MTRTRSGDRFYNPPPMRRNQHRLLLQKQIQRAFNSDNRIDSAEVETRADSDYSTLCMSNSVSASPPINIHLTNLDRLMESVTPAVSAQYLPEARLLGRRTQEADIQPFFCLGELWESFKEWSVYGAGVPLLLNGSDTVKQYYVPSLSGIQLYVDPSRLRRHGEYSDAESSKETSGAGSSDFEAEKHTKGGVDGADQHYLKNLNSQGMQRLILRDKPLHCSSNDEMEISSSHGLLVYEYLEQEQPHCRKPLYDKASPFHVHEYKCVKVVVGKNQVPFEVLSGGKAYSMTASSKIALPVFGLASYKFRGSILTPIGAHEWQQANSLLQAADNWLRSLEVHPDVQAYNENYPYYKDFCLIRGDTNIQEKGDCVLELLPDLARDETINATQVKSVFEGAPIDFSRNYR
ncbi:hypothetical protein GH714_037725 [Hevea brasiliensis]|uniref:DUF789 domain-containing protein n=1 Tax=Hevea brasiliensis TaxID=3981 RepID=A0A6A6LW39_HEVBR|nr:hypothetical protein GH714_037725 [Hevea brasiliensis]